MKNRKSLVIMIVMIAILLFFYSISCGASQSFFPPDPSHAPYRIRSGCGDQEYEKQIQITKKTIQDQGVKEMPHNFVHYRAFLFLGSFSEFRIYCPHIICPWQCLNSYEEHSHEWKYEYEFEIKRTETRIYKAVVEVQHCKMDEIEPTASLDALADSADMRLLDAAYHGEEQNIRLDSAMYHYDNEGKLRWIKWEDDNRTFTLTVDTHWHIRDIFWGTWKDNMASYEDDEGIVAELLNPQTAKSALREIRARVAFGAVSDKVYIVIAICGGALILVAAVATYLVLRKKVKNTTRLAGNGGNSDSLRVEKA